MKRLPYRPQNVTAKEAAQWYLDNAIPDNGCLISNRRTNSWGYVFVQIGGRFWPLHRFVYRNLVEPVPDNLQVIHSCDRRNCIALNHLRVGTAKDNSQDMVRRRRGRNQFGSHYER